MIMILIKYSLAVVMGTLGTMSLCLSHRQHSLYAVMLILGHTARIYGLCLAVDWP